jgi:hypothetical protein
MLVFGAWDLELFWSLELGALPIPHSTENIEESKEL